MYDISSLTSCGFTFRTNCFALEFIKAGTERDNLSIFMLSFSDFASELDFSVRFSILAQLVGVV